MRPVDDRLDSGARGRRQPLDQPFEHEHVTLESGHPSRIDRFPERNQALVLAIDGGNHRGGERVVAGGGQSTHFVDSLTQCIRGELGLESAWKDFDAELLNPLLERIESLPRQRMLGCGEHRRGGCPE